MKTVRFAEVVEKAGRPVIHPLWVAPAEDHALQAAIRQHRVATVHQELRGGKKDFATVGFHEEPAAQFLVFPKSVQRFAERRMIAINYDLLAADTGTPEKRATAKPKSQPKATASKAAPEPVERPREPPPTPEAEPPQPAETSAPSPAPSKLAKPEAPSKRAARKAVPPTRPADDAPPVDGRVLAEVRRAMKELKAGKPVAAYERLGRLVEGGAGAPP